MANLKAFSGKIHFPFGSNTNSSMSALAIACQTMTGLSADPPSSNGNLSTWEKTPSGSMWRQTAAEAGTQCWNTWETATWRYTNRPLSRQLWTSGKGLLHASFWITILDSLDFHFSSTTNNWNYWHEYCIGQNSFLANVVQLLSKKIDSL